MYLAVNKHHFSDILINSSYGSYGFCARNRLESVAKQIFPVLFYKRAKFKPTTHEMSHLQLVLQQGFLNELCQPLQLHPMP
jgi:hypothetical protein